MGYGPISLQYIAILEMLLSLYFRVGFDFLASLPRVYMVQDCVRDRAQGLFYSPTSVKLQSKVQRSNNVFYFFREILTHVRKNAQRFKMQ